MNLSGVKALVGIPYEKMNCWELTREFYLRILGISLKHVSTDPRDRMASRDLIYSSMGEFRRVSEPRFGDLILIRVRGIESHIAVYLENGMMLHTTEGIGSVVDRTDRWMKLIVGFYRPKELQ